MIFKNLIKVSPIKIQSSFIFFHDDIYINQDHIIKLTENVFQKNIFSFGTRYRKEVNLTPQLINRILNESFCPLKSSKNYFIVWEITLINGEKINILKKELK